MEMRRGLKITLSILAVVIAVVAVAIGGFRVAAALRETARVAELAPAFGKHVSTRSGRVFIQEAGPEDGVPVVLFHGTAAWSELWRETMSALADAGFRAIALDLPPFGFSDRPGTYTRVDQANRVRDVLDGLKIDNAIIVGHSFGAGAAAETVLRFPDRARGLVLVDAALGLTSPNQTSSPAPFYLQPRWLREILVSLTITNPLATRKLLSMLIEKKERAGLYAPVLQRPLPLEHTTSDVATWLLYFMGDDRAGLSSDRNAYAKITAKTGIIWGDKDDVTPLAQAEDLRALLPRAVYTVLPGIGHIPHIEDPQSFNRALIAQLTAMK